VRLRTAADHTGSVLEVSDTGIGIPSSAIPHVFDRFFRVDQARSREDGGAGLGLSIVKSICSVHGAEIEVDSRVESGSCFRVRFPRRSGSAVTGGPAAPRTIVSPGTESRVVPLLIDTAANADRQAPKG
jgi:signal transduction histidine kinase